MSGPPMIVGIVLAAGAGSRLGQPKAGVTLGDQRLLDRAVLTLLDGGCDRVVAVVREADASGLSPLPDKVVAVVNRNPELGMSSSLRLGLEAVLANQSAAAALIVLVDQVGIASSDVARVIAAFRATGRVTLARRGGHRSHPALIPREFLRDAADAAFGDSGARAFLDGHAELTHVELDDVVTDIDTADDLSRARARISGSGLA